jgi:2,5-diketo-D-gluconate reductase A
MPDPEAWSPMGLGHRVPGSGTVAGMARAHGVTPAQVVLRWEVQQGIVTIPKSASPERQRENLDVFGFELTEDEMPALAAMDRGEDAAADSGVHEEF